MESTVGNQRMRHNPTLKRDCAKARSPLAPRYGALIKAKGTQGLLLRYASRFRGLNVPEANETSGNQIKCPGSR